jgi:hypothetical protein
MGNGEHTRGARAFWWAAGAAAFIVQLALCFPPVELWSLWYNDPELATVARRGRAVLDQVSRLGQPPRDTLHGAIQWRLIPQVLPFPLAWSYVGAFGVCLYVAYVATRAGLSRIGIVVVPLVFSSAAWMYSSITLLGYCDSLVVLGLVVVSFERGWPVLVAVTLCPWVDERFVIGYPVALLARVLANHAVRWRGAFTRADVWATALLAIITSIRLFVLPTGVHSTPSTYLQTFKPFAAPLGWTAFGALCGWRLAWIPVVYVLRTRTSGPWASLVIALVVTALVGTAQDFSRSMMFVAPVVLVGLLLSVDRLSRVVALGLATVAVLLPAVNVLGKNALIVNTWNGQRWLPDPEERKILRMDYRSIYGPAPARGVR